MRRLMWFFLILLFGLAVSREWPPHSAFAQSALKWSKPVLISRSDNFAFTPFMVADQSGNLHVVWSQNDRQLAAQDLDLDTIYYAAKRGSTWSVPSDILAVSDSRSQARVNRLRIDDSGRLHLVAVTWNEVIYATALVQEAASTRGWQVSRIGEPAWLADIAIAKNGVVHLVYTNQRRGVYYRQSTDGGVSWTSPASIWLAPSEGYSGANVRIEVDDNGILHVAWGITAAIRSWNSYGISYARSADNGKTWQVSLDVVEGDNLPNIGFDNQGGSHLVWDNPASSMVGRGHAWSIDGGRTWKKPERIFPNYRGQTWWPVMARDSAGAFYLIFAADSPQVAAPRTFLSQWQSDRWSAPEVISGNLIGRLVFK